MDFESFDGQGISIPDLVTQAAAKHGVPDDIAHTLIGKTESGYNPLAKNPKSSATGLGQIINSTGRMLGMNITGGPDDDRWNPVLNADKSMQYLAGLYKDSGSWETALARYGEGREYARRILAQANRRAASRSQNLEFEPYNPGEAPADSGQIGRAHV